jgi:hypothetical protein
MLPFQCWRRSIPILSEQAVSSAAGGVQKSCILHVGKVSREGSNPKRPNYPEWNITGAVQARIAAQNGHIVVGFVADRAVREIGLQKHYGRLGNLFSCELTPAN